MTRIRELEAELHQASRREITGGLTASLAHELNQPLGAILNNAQAARRMLTTKKNVDDVKECVDDIIRDDARAVETIKTVRALFQQQEVDMRPVDLPRLLGDVERIVRADAAARHITMLVKVPASLPTVVGNKTQLVQALVNLVLNAFDAVCESGCGLREVEVRGWQAETGHVHMAVRDSGYGIGPDVMPRLFDTFFTTKPNGMGLGLSIVRSIVEKHGGRLWARQNPDSGATLEFSLPTKAASPSH